MRPLSHGRGALRLAAHWSRLAATATPHPPPRARAQCCGVLFGAQTTRPQRAAARRPTTFPRRARSFEWGATSPRRARCPTIGATAATAAAAHDGERLVLREHIGDCDDARTDDVDGEEDPPDRREESHEMDSPLTAETRGLRSA